MCCETINACIHVPCLLVYTPLCRGNSKSTIVRGIAQQCNLNTCKVRGLTDTWRTPRQAATNSSSLQQPGSQLKEGCTLPDMHRTGTTTAARDMHLSARGSHTCARRASWSHPKSMRCSARASPTNRTKGRDTRTGSLQQHAGPARAVKMCWTAAGYSWHQQRLRACDHRHSRRLAHPAHPRHCHNSARLVAGVFTGPALDAGKEDHAAQQHQVHRDHCRQHVLKGRPALEPAGRKTAAAAGAATASTLSSMLATALG